MGTAQGYLDLNSISPEFILVPSCRKGTYFPDVADFSAAGTAAFETFCMLPRLSSKQMRARTTIIACQERQILERTVISGRIYSDGPWKTPKLTENGLFYLPPRPVRLFRLTDALLDRHLLKAHKLFGTGESASDLIEIQGANLTDHRFDFRAFHGGAAAHGPPPRFIIRIVQVTAKTNKSACVDHDKPRKKWVMQHD